MQLTAEWTRRREFIQASPDQLSYETRSRRSRPTICSARPDLLSHTRWVRLVSDHVIFDTKRRRRNGALPVARRIHFHEDNKPSQVTLMKCVTCAGSFAFHHIDGRSR